MLDIDKLCNQFDEDLIFSSPESLSPKKHPRPGNISIYCDHYMDSNGNFVRFSEPTETSNIKDTGSAVPPNPKNGRDPHAVNSSTFGRKSRRSLFKRSRSRGFNYNLYISRGSPYSEPAKESDVEFIEEVTDGNHQETELVDPGNLFVIDELSGKPLTEANEVVEEWVDELSKCSNDLRPIRKAQATRSKILRAQPSFLKYHVSFDLDKPKERIEPSVFNNKGRNFHKGLLAKENRRISAHDIFHPNSAVIAQPRNSSLYPPIKLSARRIASSRRNGISLVKNLSTTSHSSKYSAHLAMDPFSIRASVAIPNSKCFEIQTPIDCSCPVLSPKSQRKSKLPHFRSLMRKRVSVKSTPQDHRRASAFVV